MGRATEIVLTVQQRQTLEAWSRSKVMEFRYVERARIILDAARGDSTSAIARRH